MVVNRGALLGKLVDLVLLQLTELDELCVLVVKAAKFTKEVLLNGVERALGHGGDLLAQLHLQLSQLLLVDPLEVLDLVL